MFTHVKNWLNGLYEELTLVNESPHRVSLSFAVGVFLGILPFTGVLAAIAIAWALRLNKAAAILGSAITNTWLGLIVLGFAVKIGAALTGANWRHLQDQLTSLLKDFSLKSFQQVDIWSLLFAVIVGYVVLSVAFALVGYGIARMVIFWHRRAQFKKT